MPTLPAEGSGPHVIAGRRRPRLGRKESGMAYLFISPALILFIVFTMLPAVMALFFSFTNYDILSALKWVGMDNFVRLWNDEMFFRSLLNVTYYTVLFVPSMIVFSLAVALALNRDVPGMRLFRTIYYAPMVTSTVAASTVWIWLLHRDYGLINQLLSYVGIHGPAWLSNSNTAMIAIVVVTLWQGLGGNMIIYLAGLQGIPEHLYEAATVEGANKWQVFRYVTWPALRPTTFFVTINSLIGSFQLFDQAYVMTKGGPGNATMTVVYNIYQSGFEQLQMGYASAQAFVLFLIILVVSLINIRFNRENMMV